jgi:hypothetical protein
VDALPATTAANGDWDIVGNAVGGGGGGVPLLLLLKLLFTLLLVGDVDTWPVRDGECLFCCSVGFVFVDDELPELARFRPLAPLTLPF